MILKHLPLLNAIIAVFTVGLCWGIIIPVTSVILEGMAVATPVIGLMASAIFIGMAMGAPGVGKCIERFGVQPVLLSGLVVSSLLMIILALFTSVPIWIGLRFVLGVTFGAVIISSEVLINIVSSEDNRGRNLGWYAFAFSFSLMITPVALWLMRFGTGVPFIFGGLACLAAAFSMRTTRGATHHDICSSESRGQQRLSTRISLSLTTNFVAGFMEGALIALIPLYTLRQGFDNSQTGILLSSFMLGHGGGPPIIGMLADRMGLRRVLTLVYCLGLVIFITILISPFRMGLAVPLLMAGMSVGALYPLAVGLIGEQLQANELPRGNAMITAAYSVGSILGPLMPALIMHISAPQSLFVISAAVYGMVLLLMSLQRPH